MAETKQKLVARSGEVFYVENGVLLVCESEGTYERMLRKREYMAQTFIVDFGNGTRKGAALWNLAALMSIILELPDTAKQLELMDEVIALRKKGDEI